MEQERVLGGLPEIYATALRLRAAGVDEAGVATRLDMQPEAVGPLLRIAAAKLDALLDRDGGTGEHP
jgi:hypothetical protein